MLQTVSAPTLRAQFKAKELKAPGVIWKKTVGEGRIPIWIASKRARALGFAPKTCRLHGSKEEIFERALTLEAECKSFLRGYVTPRRAPITRFRDRIDDMLDLYQDHEASNFSKVEDKTRETYSRQLNFLRREIGSERVSILSKLDAHRWYTKFRAPKRAEAKERISQAHALMSMLRIVCAFCTGLYPGADKLRDILSSMRFETPRGRTEQYLTAEMVTAFCREANRRGRKSQALATKLQFETALRQGDVIGRWRRQMPTRAFIWRDGLAWDEHISAGLILRKRTNKSKGREIAMADLTMCEMVVEELKLAFPGSLTEERVIDHESGQMVTRIKVHRELLPASGPVILDEDTGEPYVESKFRRVWRALADAAGIAGDLQNRDIRASAVTEGSDAEAPDEHLRSFATHKKFEMTQHYNRATLHKSRTVHARRSDLRKRRQGGQSIEPARHALEYEPAE